MKNEKLNIKKHIIILSTILFGGIFLFLLLHNIFHILSDNLDNNKVNERNRYEISEVIVENIIMIEKDFYNLFVVKKGINKEIIQNELENNFFNLRNALRVLKEGGILSVKSNLNYENKFEFNEILEYHPKDNSIAIEAIELIPKIEHIQQMLDDIYILTDLRDSLIESKQDVEKIEEVRYQIFDFSRNAKSYFKRTLEDANRALYTGLTSLQSIDNELEQTRTKYKYLEQIFLILITIIMIYISFRTIKEINRINSILIETRQAVNTSLEELEQTNAQLTQEMAEKQLAEESLEISKERLKIMWNSVHSGVLLIRKDNGNIVECNPAAQRMLKLPLNSIINSSCHNFIINSVGEECNFGVIEGGSSNADCFILESSGKTIPILKTDTLIKINEIDFWLTSFTDVSILKEAEKALLSAKLQAENADKLKSIFIAQMSHEIRTPINTMLSMSSLLEMETASSLDEEQMSYFSLIARSGNRITRTIDLLINLSEIQAGTYETVIKRYDLYSDIFSGLLVEYKNRAKDKNINLVVNFNTKDSQLYCDSYTVEQIFRQILDNAIIFTEKGVISINVFRNSSSKLVVEVEDTGIGISEEYLKKIFTPFTQEEMGYTRKFDGNGIGLSLVKNYCELNKAEVQVESEKGVGSVLRVIFNK